MNISCDIIKDLLPLYKDDVCRFESRKLVEEHLMVCGDCKAELEAMNNYLVVNNVEDNLQESNMIKNISKRWRKSMKISLLKGILTTLITVIVIVLILYVFVDIKISY